MENASIKKVPKGWNVYPTASYSRSMLLDEGYCKYIHYGDIHTRFDTFLDISKETLPYINKDMVKKFVYLEDGDIIISDTSEDYEGVGKLIEVVKLGDSKVISGLNTLSLRPKTDELINGFKGYLFNEERVRLEFLKYVTSIKVYSISKNCLAKVPILDETIQESIASKVQEGFAMKTKSKRLLNVAKEAVEIAINENEETAMSYIKEIEKCL